jgi:hypothetical protein
MLKEEEILKLTDEQFFAAHLAGKMTMNQFLFYFYTRP